MNVPLKQKRKREESKGRSDNNNLNNNFNNNSNNNLNNLNNLNNNNLKQQSIRQQQQHVSSHNTNRRPAQPVCTRVNREKKEEKVCSRKTVPDRMKSS